MLLELRRIAVDGGFSELIPDMDKKMIRPTGPRRDHPHHRRGGLVRCLLLWQITDLLRQYAWARLWWAIHAIDGPGR